jgi:acyl transferase domain-containing protein
MAAGMISLVKVMGMLKHRVFLPSGGLTKPRKDFDWAVSFESVCV